MKKIKTIGILAVLSGVLLMGCSRNAAPAISAPFQSAPVYVQSDCDSSVQAAVAAVEKALRSKDTAGCAELLCSVVELTDKLNTSDKKLVELKEKLLQITAVPVTVFTGKVKNSFNDIQKNSNNSTEIIRLKNSMLIQVDTIGQLHTDKNILGSRVRELQKEITKNKNSNTGPGTNTVKSGNTTDKAPVIAWLLVFLAGGVFFQIVPYLFKTYLFPWLGKLSIVKKLLT